jgi:hypothetical protein
MAASKLEEILKCSICLEVIKDPVTLAGCLHNYCKECIEQVPRVVHQGKTGWACPQCNQFSPDDHSAPTFFIQNVLEFHNENFQRSCGQCQQKDNVLSECVDCKMYVCDNCLVGHTRIPTGKGHRVVPINEQDRNVMDSLVFCTVHKDEVIKFNCHQCEIPLCIKCKVLQHEGHDTEEVDDALKRLQQTLTENTDKIEGHKKSLEAQIKALEEEIQVVEDEYTYCSKSLKELSEKTH